MSTWTGGLLSGVADGEYMYFVHSFIVEPADPSLIWATTRYGEMEFCSSAGKDNVFGCQFHPERSGLAGLRIYANLAERLGVHGRQDDV